MAETMNQSSAPNVLVMPSLEYRRRTIANSARAHIAQVTACTVVLRLPLSAMAPISTRIDPESEA